MEQPYGHQPPPTVPPRRHSVVGRTLRLLFLRFSSALGFISRVLRPHWLLALVSVLLVGVLTLEGLMLLVPMMARMASAQGSQRVEAIPPAEVVERYIQGQRDFDAALIWDTFSEDLKTELRSQGGSQVSLEAQVKEERDSGQRYVKFDYIGGVNAIDGSSRFFYLVQIESPNPRQNGMVSYVFTVDPAGKIANIEMGASAH